MLKNRLKISGLFISFGVLLAAIVVGTTYISFQRDLQLLKVKDTGQYSSILYEITTNMIHLEYEIINYLENGSEFPSDVEEMNSLFKQSLNSLKSRSDQYRNLPDPGYELFSNLESFAMDLERRLRTAETVTLIPLVSEGQSIVQNIENFSNMVTLSESEANAQIHDSIKASSRNSIILSFLTVLLSILGMAYFIRLNSQNEMMARNNQILANRSEASSLAKSRLLSMLSHEIRTPMNGVLGLVSLALNQKLSDTQRKLMEQIRGSAMELITFLEDMLDFSSLEEMDVKQTQSLLYTTDLIVQLEERLKPMFIRNGKTTTFTSDESLPKLLKGDGGRIQQSLYYLLSHISKNSPEKDFAIRSTLFSNYWLWRIDLRASEGTHDSWEIGSLMGQDDEFEFIASDTIETAMARGMIESMHGEIRLVRGNVQKDVYRLLVYIPIQTITKADSLKVYIHQSRSNKLEINALMEDIPHKVLELHQLSEADLVLCDPNNSSELKELSELRKAAPLAHIVSLGHTDFSDLYDDVFESQLYIRPLPKTSNFERIYD